MADEEEEEEEDEEEPWFRHKRWWISGVLLVLVVIVDLVAAFRFTVDKDLRGSILGLLTPVVALIAGGAALLNFQETRRQNNRTFKTSQRQLDLARNQLKKQMELQWRGQVTERFTKAIEQLGQVGADRLDIRIGGIYALAEIARDSPELHWPIMQVLTAFLRERTRGAAGPEKPAVSPNDPPGQEAASNPAMPGSLGADFQAAMTVLCHRNRDHDRGRLNLRRAQLRGLELEGDDVHLERVDFSGAQLDKACFRSARLDGANFSDAYLENAIFDGAGLKDAIFCGALLKKAVFDNAQLEGAKWEVPATRYLAEHQGVEWVESRLPTQLQGTRFRRAQLPRARFGEAQLHGADFSGALLEGANFWDAQLAWAKFQDAELQGAYFGGTKTDLRHAIFNDGHLQGAKFHGAQLQEAWFKGDTELQKSEFLDAQLDGAEFGGAHMQEASFQDAQLRYAHFWWAELQSSRFWNAQLEGSSFADALLQCADFTGAKLHGAHFDRAQLNGAIFSTKGEANKIWDAEGLELEQLARAANLEDVVLPSYLRRDDLDRLPGQPEPGDQLS